MPKSQNRILTERTPSPNYLKEVMKSKGFNWFYLIFAAVLLMLFLPGLMSSSDTRKLDEKSFYALLSQNKIKNVVVLKDTDVAQVFNT